MSIEAATAMTKYKFPLKRGRKTGNVVADVS
jgi:hypothetical protein